MKPKTTILITVILLAVALALGGWFWFDGRNENSSNSDGNTAQDGVEEKTDQSISTQLPVEIEHNTDDDEPAQEQPQAKESVNGTIVLNHPADNQTIDSSVKIAGTSESSNLSYRIVYEGRGMVSQGKLPVKNNSTFSSTISGLQEIDGEVIIEVYSSDPETLAEKDSVEVTVRFAQ